MADFLADSRVQPDPEHAGRFHAALSPDWAVWGPHGGYLAAVALRAMLDASRPRDRRASSVTSSGSGPSHRSRSR